MLWDEDDGVGGGDGGKTERKIALPESLRKLRSALIRDGVKEGEEEENNISYLLWDDDDDDVAEKMVDGENSMPERSVEVDTDGPLKRENSDSGGEKAPAESSSPSRVDDNRVVGEEPPAPSEASSSAGDSDEDNASSKRQESGGGGGGWGVRRLGASLGRMEEKMRLKQQQFREKQQQQFQLQQQAEKQKAAVEQDPGLGESLISRFSKGASATSSSTLLRP